MRGVSVAFWEINAPFHGLSASESAFFPARCCLSRMFYLRSSSSSKAEASGFERPNGFWPRLSLYYSTSFSLLPPLRHFAFLIARPEEAKPKSRERGGEEGKTNSPMALETFPLSSQFCQGLSEMKKKKKKQKKL